MAAGRQVQQSQSLLLPLPPLLVANVIVVVIAKPFVKMERRGGIESVE
jgi:hypothetical protein